MERAHSQLSLRQQAQLLAVNRNRLEPRPRITEEDQRLMRDLDELHTRWPVYGPRKLQFELGRRGWQVGRKRVRRLMRLMGLEAIAPKPRTSQPSPEHKKYPYLLRELAVERPDQVWCADLTYIRLHGGFAYLVALMDWHSRAVLAWRISNTLEAGFLRGRLSGGGAGRRRGAGHHEHRPGRAVHRPGMDQRRRRQRCAGEHGRPGALAGQRVH